MKSFNVKGKFDKTCANGSCKGSLFWESSLEGTWDLVCQSCARVAAYGIETKVVELQKPIGPHTDNDYETLDKIAKRVGLPKHKLEMYFRTYPIRRRVGEYGIEEFNVADFATVINTETSPMIERYKLHVKSSLHSNGRRSGASQPASLRQYQPG